MCKCTFNVDTTVQSLYLQFPKYQLKQILGHYQHLSGGT